MKLFISYLSAPALRAWCEKHGWAFDDLFEVCQECYGGE